LRFIHYRLAFDVDFPVDLVNRLSDLLFADLNEVFIVLYAIDVMEDWLKVEHLCFLE